MDDVIAVEVRLAEGGSRYFVTWGRIQDAVDPAPVEALVLEFARRCSLGGTAASAHLCPTLRTAADSHEAPYFYEALVRYREPPFGDAYEAWRAQRAAAMQDGMEIFYCGRPG